MTSQAKEKVHRNAGKQIWSIGQATARATTRPSDKAQVETARRGGKMVANIHSRAAEHEKTPSVHAHTQIRDCVKLQGLPKRQWQPLLATVDSVTAIDKGHDVTATATGRELPEPAHKHM